MKRRQPRKKLSGEDANEESIKESSYSNEDEDMQEKDVIWQRTRRPTKYNNDNLSMLEEIT